MTISVKDMSNVGQITISGSFEDLFQFSEAVPAPVLVLQEKLGLMVDLEGRLEAVVIRVPKAFKGNNTSSKGKIS